MATSAIVTGTATGAAMQKAQKRGGNGPPPLVAWHYSHPRSPNAERSAHRTAGPDHKGGSSVPVIPRPLYARIILSEGKVMSLAITAHVVCRLVIVCF